MKTRAQKEEAVVKLKEKFSKAKSVVFADYRGLTMSQLSDIRNKIKDQQAEFSITKNTLLQKALEGTEKSIADEKVLQGPVATLFSFDDEVSPIKVLVKAIKEFQIGKVKGGFLGDEYLVDLKINSLANLPSKQELQGKTVGILVAPLSGMVNVLQGNLRNLLYALNEIKAQKGA